MTVDYRDCPPLHVVGATMHVVGQRMHVVGDNGCTPWATTIARLRKPPYLCTVVSERPAAATRVESIKTRIRGTQAPCRPQATTILTHIVKTVLNGIEMVHRLHICVALRKQNYGNRKTN